MELRYAPESIHYCLLGMEPGRKRRETLKEIFERDPSIKIPVDQCHCIQVHRDPDLRKLVKSGFLVKGREQALGGICRHSYLYHPV